MTRIHAKQIAVLACAALLTVASSAHAGKPKFSSRGNGGGNSSSSQGGSMNFSGNGLSSRIKQSGGFQVVQKQQTQVQQNNLHGLGIHLNKGNKNGNSNGNGIGNAVGNGIGNGIGNGNLKKHLPQINIGIGNGNKPHVIDPKFGVGGNSAQFKTKSFWCSTQPKHCWWWYDYCPGFCVQHPTHYHCCDYYYLPISAQYQWYLGVKGIVLPNKGLAINEVDAFSPAALAGLQPGMVITRCNGFDLVSEQAVSLALAAPNGLLQMEVFVEGAAAPVPVTIQMRAVPVVVH